MSYKKKYEDYLSNFNNMSAKRQVAVLWDALDYMNMYNGRSREDCIVLALAELKGADGMSVIDDRIEREDKSFS